MKHLPRPSLWVLVAALVLLPIMLPNNYALDIAVRVALAAVAAIGLNLAMGFAGQVSIGHAAFLAIGAYASGIIGARYSWPPLVGVAAAAACAGVVAWLIAKPVLRLRGHSLTMATLGLGVIVNIALVNEVALTGGPDGMPMPPFEVLGFIFAKVMHWYALSAVLLVVAVLLSLNLFDSPAGRALRGMNGAEVAARVAGVDVGSFKVRAFVASAVFASVAGSLTAYYVGFISPSLASFSQSVELATMVVLGGMASTFGALLGAAVLTVLPQLLGGLHGYESILFGLILMVTMIFLPRGVVPSLALLFKRSR